MALPRHVAIIMDGNGRWAKMRGLPRFEGHKMGVQRTKEIINASLNVGIEVLSLYAFSLENWLRSEEEVSVIMSLLESTLKGEFLNFVKLGIRFRVIGNRSKLPEHILAIIESLEEATKNNKKLTLQCALSYGGRDEILRTVKKILNSGLKSDDITEATFSSYLDTSGTPDPDLIVRTSGEQRLSNFLLWQSAYSELYFTDTLWPDFTEKAFMDAIYDYQKRERRFGKTLAGNIFGAYSGF
jgi:undecaprenyl diphosphate synthase